MTLPAPWEPCPWLPPTPPLIPVFPAACEHSALRGPPFPSRPHPLALTPDLVDKPGEGTGCSQHTIGPPRSSPAQGIASKLPHCLQRLVLTGVRLDLAVCPQHTPNGEDRVTPPSPTRGSTTFSPGCYLLPFRAEHPGRGPALPLVGQGVSEHLCRAAPRIALTSCSYMYVFYDVFYASYWTDPNKDDQEHRDLTPSQRVPSLITAGDLTWLFLLRGQT